MSSVSTPDLIEEASLLDTYDLVSLLQGRAELQPFDTAFVFLEDGERERVRLSFSDLDRRARSIAARLQNSGLTGQRAFLLYPPGLDYIEAFFGCLYAGVIAVPAYPPSGRHLQRLQAIFRDASPALVMTVKELRERFAAGTEGGLGQAQVPWLATDELDTNGADAWAPFAADPDSLAFLQYTSGSTGNPRGVMVSHANLLFNQALIRQSFQHTKHSTLVGWLPLYHDMGLIGNILQPLFVGSAAYLMSPLAFLEKPFRWLQAISTYHARTSGGPNFAFDLCARKITREQKRDLDLSCWTVAFSGAEPVRATTLDRFAAAFADCGFRRENFFPCYGLAEATLVVTAPTRGRSVALRRADRNALGTNRIAEPTTGAALALVGCGHTWPGHDVRIVNPETTAPCADGEIGEIWVAGPSVAKGYWNQLENSARVFQARLDREDTGRFLRTGDLGFLERGELFVTGRLKDLIIIAGRNHYPQDFERVLDEQVEALRPGSSAAFSVTNDDQESLVIVAEPQRAAMQTLQDNGPHALFRQIRDSLAGECDVAPAEIVLVQPGSIPKTSSGKIRHASCRQDYLNGHLRILARSGHEPASSALARDTGMPPSAEAGNPLLQEALALIAPQQRIELIARFLISNTARLLRIPDSDLRENMRIMTSGLDSLRAIELKHMLDVLLGADIPLHLLLKDMTFRQIAEALNCLATPNDDVPSFQDTEPRVSYGLSYSQQAMWAVHQLDPSGIAYNLHLALRIKGRVDSSAFRRSFDYLLERHPILRGMYRQDPEGVVQTLLSPASRVDNFSIVYAEGWPEDKLQRNLGSQAIRPFDLASGAVLRMTLYRHGDHSATLLLCAHHIALDLWSLLIFLKELEEVYKITSTQQVPNLPRITANYQNFVAWQRQYESSQASDADWAYWRNRLAGDLPILALAIDHPRPPAPANLGSAFRLQLDPELTVGLKAVARAHGATLFMVLLAAYKILLYRHTHQRDIIVGSASSGRSQSRFSPVIGNFVNPLALRTNLKPDQPFSDYLCEVRNCVTDALEHQNFPFSVLVERLQPERLAGQWPIFQTWFVLQQAQADVTSGYAQLALGESTAPLSLGEWEIEGLPLDDRIERFDLKLMAAETDQGLILSFQYRRDLFCEDTISQLADQFRSLAEAIVASPQTRITALPLLDVKQIRQQLTALQVPEKARVSAKCVHHIFAEWAQKTPEAPAVVCADRRLTYAELESKANQLAYFLRRRAVEGNVPVGLCVTRSAETIIAILGILKAGGAYIPIDPDLPSRRISGMLQDAGAKVLLCRQEWFKHSGITTVEPIFLDSEQFAIDAQPNDSLAVHNSPLDLAYIIFTSGSTGLPKGAAITHQGLANYTAAILARLPAEHGLHFGLVSTFAADLGNTVLFPALAGGGCLHVLTYDEATDPLLFRAHLARHPIDVLKIVPSHYNALIRPGEEADALPRKVLIFGGETLPWSFARRVLSVVRPPQLFNHYGPTETTVGALMLPLADELDPARASAVPIGRPIENMCAFVLGPNFTFQPQGMSGEICLGGVGLAQGYVGRPDLTAERFIPDPFASRPGERLYRTGDLGRVMRDGDLEFLGRIDQQVKIRGFRIEPGEIESILSHHASVIQAVVVVLSDKPGVSRLVAYVVLEKRAAVDEGVLLAWLRQFLPDYMVPAAVIFLDAIPVTQNGKIDRKRLPIPNLDETLHIHRAPRNEIEANLAGIYASLLQVDRIGIDDNFFALGGDSILSIQAASRAHAAGLNISPRQIFQHQTIAELATAIALLPAAAKPLSSIAASRKRFPFSTLSQLELDRLTTGISGLEDVYPLTPLQEGLLFHTLSQPNTGVYVMQHHYWIDGEIDVSVFRAAWQSIVDTHSIFRTAFVWDGFSRSQQIVYQKVELPFDYLDLRRSPKSEQDKWLDNLLAEERRTGFDLGKAPLGRIRLVHLEDNRYLLIRSHHHILFDAWCTSLILSELQSNYGALIKGQHLPQRTGLGFRDYIAWLQRQDLNAAEPFWRQYLEGFSEPTPLIAAALSETEGENKVSVEDLVFYLSEDDTAELKALAQRYQVTPNTFAQAALALLLARYTSRRDVLFGITVSGRPAELPEVESILGLFINGLPLRVSVDPSASLPSFLRKVLEYNYAIRDYEYVSLTQVQNWSEIPRGVELFQYLLTFENAPVDSTLLEPTGDWWFTDCRHRTHTNYPITFVVIPGPRLHLQLTYASSYFDRASAERLLFHYRYLLEGMIRRPDARLGELGLLSASERRQFLEDWNATSHDYGEPRDLIGRFEAQVLENPAAAAASCCGVTLSYQALNEKANRLAHVLIGEGVGPDSVVALLDERGLDFLATMLAIFKAGAAYLPLDPAHPDGRIAQVLEESHVGLLLAGAACHARAAAIVAAMSEPKPRLLDLAALDKRESRLDNPPRRHAPQNLAFVIYTSGSTGKPKGAMVEHQGMFNNLITKVPALELTALDVIAQTASQCFDISVWQFLTALTLGARVEIFPDAISRDPQRLLEEIAARGVTILEAVPSMIRALLDAAEAGAALAGLRWLLPCGEAFAPELCRRFMERYPRVRLLNAYGPAECSDDVSYYPILTPPGGNDLSVPIGRPVDNTRLYLLNRWLEPAPVGAPGEICVGGVQVGRGYLHRPDLTAAAFLPDPFGPPGARLYHTGDLGRYRADGVIEFLGRVDHQVKIRGHRIEPGEVEACLATHPRVHATAVVAQPAGPGIYRLVAYVVGMVEADELRQHLRATLPDYMIPAAFVSLEALPLTPNGKVDRKALPEPDLSAQLAHRFVAPRTPTEEILAQIWADVLRLERVGINDNFFELGGHSLMAITLIERMRRHGLQADVRALFMSPTPAALAAVAGVGAEIVFPPNLIPVGCDSIRPEMLPLVELTQTDIDRIVEEIPGGASNVQDIYPLAPLQEGMLFHHLMATEGDPYQLVTLLAFDLRERLEDFLRALEAVISRHDILRTSLAWDGLSEPVQVVWRDAPLIMENVTLDPAVGDIATQMLARFDACQYRFDVRHAPLIRAFIVSDVGRDRWLLLLSLHHLASDHTTDATLVEEAYAYLTGQGDCLPAPVPFRNFVAHARLGVSKSEHEMFFRGMLGDVVDPTAPFGLLDVQGNGANIDEARLSLDAVLARRVREQARLLGVSTASLCHQAWAQVLACVSSRDDVVFGTVLFGRMHGGAGTDRVLGPFINTLPVRVQLGADSAAGGVRRMHRLLTALLRHEHASLALAQRCSGVSAPAPLFSALLNYRHSPAPVKRPGEVPATWDGVEILYAQERTNYPLVLSVDDFGEGFQITAQTRNPLDPDRVCGFMHVALKRLVEALESAPNATIKAIDVLSETERRQLLSEWNDTSTEYPKDCCIHELFEAQVERTPQAVAVVFGEQRLTYAELNYRANELAHRLRDFGVRPEIVVGICVERSVEMLIGLLGILKAGGAYLALAADYPRERLAFMIEDTGPLLVLTQKHLREILSESVPTLYLDADWASVNNSGWTNPARCATSANLAYITYTSGSTGRPKGVGAIHEGVVRLLKNTNYVRFNNPDETILHYAPLAFDASTFEIWAPLLNGARLVIAPPGPQLTLDDLGRVVREYGVTTLWLTAALFRRMVDYRLSDLAGVKQLLTGGDVVSAQHARKFCDTFPTNVLINGYGPTENTTFSTFHILSDLSGSGSLPIGKPIANSRVYILDRDFNVVPIGVVGELHVAGPGLARGYVSRPDLTAERFVPDPFGAPGGRLYRTGDLARHREDGNIEFLGRIDHQVKVRGFRIELGEIEAAFSQIPQVQEAVVVARADRQGDKRLIAYVVGNGGVELAAADLRVSLQQHLPDHMVPSVFVFLDALPLTVNGKVDGKALPAPEIIDVAQLDYVAPRTRVEEILADIFAQVLGFERVGIHADFFHLGGHSLIAFTLAQRISEALRCKLPLIAIFQSPSVAQLANYIEQNHVNLRRNPVVLRRGENAPSLYCVHPAGSVACYLPLARHMGGMFPIHGIDSHMILDPQYQKGSISTMATEYSKLIRKQSPHGPYRLLGWSMGGLIAHAIAADLESHGERVAFLGMLDVSLRSEVKDGARFELFAGYLNRYPEDRAAFLQMKVDERRDLAEATEHMSPEEWFLYVVAYGQDRGKWLRNISLSLLKSLFTEWWDGILLTNAHAPPCIHANMRVWWARDSLDENGRPPVDWRHYTFGATSIEVVEGNHETIVHNVNVIKSIERCLGDGKLTQSIGSDENCSSGPKSFDRSLLIS